MKIILNDNEFVTEAALTAYDAIKEAGLMTREVIAASIDGETVALTTPITEGCRLAPLTFADKEGKGVFNHTASHILAQAVKRLFPAAKLTIGPAIENGFYYDIDSDVAFTPDLLKQIEGEMKKIVKENLLIERFLLSRDEAIKLASGADFSRLFATEAALRRALADLNANANLQITLTALATSVFTML